MDNILTGDEAASLFTSEDVQKDTVLQEDNETDKENKENKEQQFNEATEVNSEDLFTEEPESVGSEKNNSKGKEQDTASTEADSSPTNFYSSIADALKEAGVFPGLYGKGHPPFRGRARPHRGHGAVRDHRIPGQHAGKAGKRIPESG